MRMGTKGLGKSRYSKKDKVSEGISSIFGKIRSFDEFGEAASMKIKDGDDKLRSFCGTCLTFLLVAITMVFLYSKAMVLYEGTDVTIIGNNVEGAFTYEDTFTADDGLFIAAALTEYGPGTEIIEKKEYGELVIEQYGWGDSGELGVKTTPLDMHYCSDAELGLDEDAEADSSTYPIFESSKKEVVTWKKKFKCIPRKDLVIWGDYNSAKAQQISVKFEMCDDTKERFAGITCKSKAEI